MQDNMLPITQPNPIATRDRLRSLPRSGPMLQQTIQYLTRAAQGGVPTVEPYIALSELNEIKRDMEKQSSTQATAGAAQSGPLLQTLPQQVKQAAGIASLQGMRQQQAMQQMMGRAGQTPGPVPEGITQEAPVQARRGGLMTLPSARFRAGGIVTFKQPTEDNNQSLVTEDGETDTEVDTGGESGGDVTLADASAYLGKPIDTNKQIENLNALIETQRNKPAPGITSKMVGPASVEEQMIRANPDRYGILATPAGQVQLNELARLQRAQAEDIRLRDREATKPSIGRIMMDAAEASRGVKGGFGQIAAMLGGAGKSAATQQQQYLKEQQALRKEGIGLVEAQGLALQKVDELRRAQAKGDVTGEYNARLALAKIEKDYGVSINNLLGKQYAAVLGYKGRVDAANIANAGRIAAAKAAQGKLPQVDRALAAARIELSRLTPGTPEYIAKEQEVAALAKTLRESRDVGSERATLMRMQIVAGEDKAILAEMSKFEFSPEMQAAKQVSEEEANRVFVTKLNQLRSTQRSGAGDSFPEGGTPAPAAAPAPKPEPVFVGTPTPLPKGATPATLKVGEVYETAKGPGRWNGTGFTPVKVQSQ